MKKKTRLQEWSKLLFALVLVFFITGEALAEKGVTDNEIVIGDLAMLTGPVSSLCAPDSMGFRTYWKYINESGGIHGRKIKVIVGDHSHSTSKAMMIWKKFINRDEIFAMTGLATPIFTALSKKIQQEKIPTFPSGQSPTFYEPPTRYMFPFMPSYQDECRVLVDYIMKDMKYYKKKDLRIGICYVEDDHGFTLLEGVIDGFKKWGVSDKIVEKQIYKRGAVDLSGQVLNIKKSKSNLVFMLMGAPMVGNFIRECAKIDFKPQFATGPSGVDNDVALIAGKASYGTIGSSSCQPWISEVTGAYKMREITARLRPNMKKEDEGMFYIYGWVKAAIMAEGLKRAGRDLDREKFVEALETLDNFVGDIGGLVGPISYGPGRRNAVGGNSRIKELVPSTRDFTKMLTNSRPPLTIEQIAKFKGK